MMPPSRSTAGRAPTRRRAVSLGVACLLALIVGLNLLGSVERRTLDAIFVLRGTVGPGAPITIVAIDDDSLRALGRWPFPRAMTGQVLDRLRAAGAAVIGLDLILSEPSARGDADDQALAESAARVPALVLAAAITSTSDASSGMAFTTVDANIPIRPLRRPGVAIGHLNVQADSDAVLRRVDLAHTFIPAFGVELHRLAVMNGIGGRELPRNSEVRINFVGGPGSFPRVPYHRVLGGQFAPETVRGRIILVGATASSLRDRLPTPLAGPDGMPGVEIHANIVDTLLTGRHVRTVPVWGQAAIAAVAAAGAATLVGAARIPGLVIVALAIVATPAIAWAAFTYASLGLPIAASTLALAGGAVSQAMFRSS